ncbi:MAG: type III-A CRISPR-associated protein Cas10/Csm1 [Thermoplasmatales archaeon]|nr:type III-A CRISPR-associated protein Cas10/Csm1 [Thermoplasmatales archaeon]
MKENEVLRLSALLHDIGKFWQRTWEYPDKNHSELGSKFAEKSDLDEISDLILNHHSPKKSKNKKIAEILQKADWESAEEREESEDNQEVRKEPLRSIFSKIDIEKMEGYKPTDWYYHLAPLMLKEEMIFPSDNKSSALKAQVLDNQYKAMWEKGFIPEFDKISQKNTNAFYTTLYHLLQKYTSYMPSAAYKSVPDIALFDHLKTTSAIADCLYKTDEEKKFLLLGGDISGIQNFIYDIFSPKEAQKDMSKRLRGRSFYISMLTETFAHHILDSLSLSISNLLWCGGGEFIILAPNTEDIRKTILDAKKRINQSLLKKFQGRLYLAVAYTEGTTLKDFPALLEEVKYNLSIEKNKKFSEILDISLFEKHPSEKVCPICGNDFVSGDFCDECKKQKEIGGNLPKMEYLIEINGKGLTYEFDICFQDMNISWSLVKDENKICDILKSLEPEEEKISSVNVYRLNNTDFLTNKISGYVDGSTLPISLGFKFIGKTAPYDDEKGVWTFEEIAEENKGSKLLGVLRMDVDNLGAILSMGLKENRTVSRVSTLSRMLDIFFSGNINKICEKLSLYITYSGGDDLFIVGPWDTLMEAAEEIRNKFKEYTCKNPNITLSAGIHHCKPKFPIGRASNIAGGKLDMAKKYGKDSITVFDETVKWETEKHADRWNGYDRLLEYAKKLEEYNREGKISKSFIYSILGFWRETFYENKKKNGFTSLEVAKQKKKYMPHFKYTLARNIDRSKYSDLFKDLDENIPKIVPWAGIPVSWVSLRTRGDKK